MVGRKVAAVLHIVECHDRIAARVQRRKQIAAAVAGEAELLIGRAGTRGQDCDTAAKQTNETSSHPGLSPWAISASGESQALLSSAFAGHELLDFVGVLFREIEIGSADLLEKSRWILRECPGPGTLPERPRHKRCRTGSFIAPWRPAWTKVAA